MKIAKVSLKSVSPMSQSRYHSTQKKEKESHSAYEERTWPEKQHFNKDGQVFIPPMAFKNCIAEAAKFLAIRIPGKGQATYTKHFVAGILVTEPLVLPNKAKDTEGEWYFVPADGVRGSGKRVEKCFPVIHEWSGDVVFTILDDTVTEEIFEKVLRDAGKFIGIGRFRPANNGFYGRFDVTKISWSGE